MRLGARLAIDLGEKRIGVARCDSQAILSLPVETVYRSDGQEIYDILDIAEQYAVIEVIVGLPRLLSGEEGRNAADVRSWVRLLLRHNPNFTVRLVDERLSSVTAHQSLTSAGMNAKAQRTVVDQQAAVCILEQALEIERRTGQAPGEAVTI